MAEVLAEELCEILELAPMPMRLVALTHALMLQISDTDEPMADAFPRWSPPRPIFRAFWISSMARFSDRPAQGVVPRSQNRSVDTSRCQR